MENVDVVFWLAAAASVGAGLFVVTLRNPIYGAIALLFCFLALAVLYLKLDAPFLAAIHVLVYTGAILVLFLFVIMLLNLKPEELGAEYPLPARAGIGLLCLGLFVVLALPLGRLGEGMGKGGEAGLGTVEAVGLSLFQDHALAFELVSVLIVAALLGGVVLAKKKL